MPGITFVEGFTDDKKMKKRAAALVTNGFSVTAIGPSDMISLSNPEKADNWVEQGNQWFLLVATKDPKAEIVRPAEANAPEA